MQRLLMLVAVFVAGLPCARADTPADLVTINVDLRQEAQSFDGFGASGAWWAQAIGEWPDTPRRKIIEALFGPQGAALSIYRYNVGGGSSDRIGDSWRRAFTFEVAPGRYDWSRDGGAVRVLREACATGVSHVILFANSPPRRMTKSGFTFGSKESGLSNLREDMYDDFATYLVDVAEHFVRQWKLPVRALSPINEPQWNWDGSSQEGCHYEPAEVVRLTKMVAEQLEQRSLDVQVEAPESGSWDRVTDLASRRMDRAPVMADALFSDPFLRDRLDAYALHSYWARASHKRAFAEYFFEKYPGKKIHMTEWCEMRGGRDVGMDSALTLAETVLDDLTLGRASSWQYWIAVSKYDFRDGLIYVDPTDRAIHLTKRLWALAHFSRFIRPGFRRIEVRAESGDLRLVAARCPMSGDVVLVVLNRGDQAATAELKLRGTDAPFTVDVYETSTDRDLQRTAEVSSPGRHNFLPKSVTTLVFTKGKST